MNFDYLKDTELKTLYEYCTKAEQQLYVDSTNSATYSRRALEYLVKFVYDTYLGIPCDGLNLFQMVTNQEFIDFYDFQPIMDSIHNIRKIGNVSAHESVELDMAISALDDLHYVVSETCRMVEIIENYEPFVLPKEEIKEIEISKEEDKKEIVVEPKVCAAYAKKLRHVTFNVKNRENDLQNKKQFLESSLREANWAIVNQDNTALEKSASVNMMINASDKADYVLNGRDNKPLAIIEFISTCTSLLDGRKEAIRKANLLEQKYGYKPIIYYTNGYLIYCIDQLGFPPRRVFSFHTLEELELLKTRQTIREDITHPIIDSKITDRYYQKEAIMAALSAFASFRRKSLLVMATGTGKTRISISLSDVLLKANWVKNILFLADRTSLVKQAHKNFNKLLPSITTSMYTGIESERDSNARIIFSTYQTMINLINDDSREFSIGRFDLIIIDEAHRSIFKKYKYLFDYFDALMLGLTATPRNEENKSTYEVFDLPNAEPDYAYEIEQAVKDGYLVGYSLLDETTEDIKNGVKYDDLSDEEKEELENNDFISEVEEDLSNVTLKTGGRIINISTIDIMLNELMTKGYKIHNGDRIGKTIIFASSHVAATQIVERFNKLYPAYGPDFCKLIDSQTDGSQNLIEKFEVRDSLPQITVSVDMMDTGIDVPDVLNLVFFKKVKSKIKFLQMIGRGTRLSKDIYGPGQDKEEFLIFDFFGNFDYFDQKAKKPKNNGLSISEQIYIKKINILKCLQENVAILNNFDFNYMSELKNEFVTIMNSLCNDNLDVELNMPYVNKYRDDSNWDNIDDDKVKELTNKITPLFPSIPEHVKVKSYDHLMYYLEKELFGKKDINYLIHENFAFGYSLLSIVNSRMNDLLKLKTIPEVVSKKSIIESMIDCKAIIKDYSLKNLENLRKELRDLMSYLPDKKRYFVINHDDSLIDGEIEVGPQPKSYFERVRDYLNNSQDPILLKIANLEDLTVQEKDSIKDQFENKLGTLEECTNWLNGMQLLQKIRLTIGIDDSVIDAKFGNILDLSVVNPMQLAFMKQVIDYAKLNGDITFKVLQTTSPFSDVDISQLFGTKVIHLKTLINGIHKPIL